ncbi:hypothetical protein XA68_11514 [Ophiocordyceps unilateralis]|uniref:Bromodomain associated domain-containing protein n=1 Tax=Ophiocordyceps unilateralis TaxID=268505 RepID=A0A2A9PEZ8_OPHUN|nr:hypothetical protein XA68_11514 [Ophiocordyceps unilateralis]
MAGQAAVYHALLRPSILQILRATGYHATKGAVLDSVTDLAARYLYALCEATAAHAAHNHGGGDFTAADLGFALRDVGALLPEGRAEDVRGLDEFLKWFAGPRMRELMDMGRDGESDATDYLAALKKKHSKTGDDNKYHGTLIGRLADATCDIQVEGGPEASVDDWVMHRSRLYFEPPPRRDDTDDEARPNGLDGQEPPSPAHSSALSSVGEQHLSGEDEDEPDTGAEVVAVDIVDVANDDDDDDDEDNKMDLL